MKGRIVALAGIALFAVSAIAIVAMTRSSGEAAPRCDGPNPPRRCVTATPTPRFSPFEGVWEGINRWGGQDWLLIEHETGGVYSIKYYDPAAATCGPLLPRLGLGSGSFEQEFNRLRWFAGGFWCMGDPAQRDSTSRCDGFVHDEASDSLTCGDWGTYQRSEVSWDDIVP